MVKKKNFLFSLIFIFFSVSIYAKKNKVKFEDFNKGLKQAIKEKKYVIVDFYGEWCGYCNKMEETTYKNKKVQKIIKKFFVLTKIDTGIASYIVRYNKEKYSTEEFMAALGINGLPATGFLDKKGKFITVIPGYIPPKTMSSILDYVKDDCYSKKIKYSDYLKSKKRCSS